MNRRSYVRARDNRFGGGHRNKNLSWCRKRMVSRNLRFRFTLVSYNILSQSLLNDHGYLYANCNPRDLEWPRRGHLILKELLSNQADIICLQEVESEHLKSLYRPRLARYGYECLYKKKTGYKIDGCAIFFKSRLFQLTKYKGIEFNRTDVTNILNRDNVGIIAVLKPKITTNSKSSHLVIANTHLIFNPRRSDIRLAQLKYFLSELEELSTQSRSDNLNEHTQHHPTILCGDLNSTPDSEISQFILRNERPDGHQDPPNRQSSHIDDPGNQIDPSSRDLTSNQEEISDIGRIDDSIEDDEDGSRVVNNVDSLDSYNHTIGFKSVYPIQNQAGQRFVTTFSSCIVDYIFYTPKKLQLESYRELITEEQLDAMDPLPNSEFASDHFPLEAKFTLK